MQNLRFIPEISLVVTMFDIFLLKRVKFIQFQEKL